MKSFTAMLTTIMLLPSAVTEAQTLTITRGGSRPVRQAPAENFTGAARVEMLFETRNPLQASAGSVTFEPGARTAWHTHPAGQILIVTAGTGRVQRWGDRIEEIRTGDVVRIPAGQKHWHGASPQASMTHIAITEPREGASVQWMEKVTDGQYSAAPAGSEPQPSKPRQTTARPSGPVQQRIAPGPAALTDDVLFGDVWRRSELSPRDRSLVTISVLIATGKPAQLAGHLGRALDNGVQASEASGVLAHLAIYGGWPSAVSALDVYDQVYTARKVDTTALTAARPRLSAAASDAARGRAVNDEFGAVAPKFVELTNDVVFDDLWRRSDLSPRDRSLITIAALAAMGDDDELALYLRRGLESGLTNPRRDRRGGHAPGLLRRLVEGDQGHDGRHADAPQVAAHVLRSKMVLGSNARRAPELRLIRAVWRREPRLTQSGDVFDRRVPEEAACVAGPHARSSEVANR